MTQNYDFKKWCEEYKGKKTEVVMFEVNKITATNTIDGKGNPAGGEVSSLGLLIRWQDGPLSGKPANGAFVEDVIEAARQRLEFYQTASNGKFACRENALAITKLEEALHWLSHRTRDRIVRGVEGTNKL